MKWFLQILETLTDSLYTNFRFIHFWLWQFSPKSQHKAIKMVSINCLQIQAKVVAVLEMVISLGRINLKAVWNQWDCLAFQVISALVFLFLLFLGITIAVKKEMLIDAMDKYPDETDHPQLRQLFEARRKLPVYVRCLHFCVKVINLIPFPVGEQIAIFLLPMLYCIGDFGLAIFLFRSVDQVSQKEKIEVPFASVLPLFENTINFRISFSSITSVWGYGWQ